MDQFAIYLMHDQKEETLRAYAREVLPAFAACLPAVSTSPAAAGEPFAIAEQAAGALVTRLGAVRRWPWYSARGGGRRRTRSGRPTPNARWPSCRGSWRRPCPGTRGPLRSVRVDGRQVLVLLGRSHFYESRSPAQVVHAVRTAVIAGAGVVVLDQRRRQPSTRSCAPGEVVLVARPPQPDGRLAPVRRGATTPLPFAFRGPHRPVRARFRRTARTVDPSLAEGVYAALPGPHYETPAEIAMLRAAGADLVGMSTALEAIAARHLGALVLGLSLVTNLAAGVSPGPLDHAEVLAAGAAAVPRLGRLLAALLPLLSPG